jgi:hypothetical protein
MRSVAVLALCIGLLACATIDVAETPSNVARGRAILSETLSQPDAQQRVTLFYAGGSGEREALADAAIEGDQVCGTLVAGTLEPVYVNRPGGGVQLLSMEWIELPPERHSRRCVSLAQIAGAKVGSHPGFLGLRLN